MLNVIRKASFLISVTDKSKSPSNFVNSCFVGASDERVVRLPCDYTASDQCMRVSIIYAPPGQYMREFLTCWWLINFSLHVLLSRYYPKASYDKGG